MLGNYTASVCLSRYILQDGWSAFNQICIPRGCARAVIFGPIPGQIYEKCHFLQQAWCSNSRMKNMKYTRRPFHVILGACPISWT